MWNREDAVSHERKTLNHTLLVWSVSDTREFAPLQTECSVTGGLSLGCSPGDLGIGLGRPQGDRRCWR
jgi:hypothetical protein